MVARARSHDLGDGTALLLARERIERAPDLEGTRRELAPSFRCTATPPTIAGTSWVGWKCAARNSRAFLISSRSIDTMD